MVAAFVGITASILTASVLFQTKPVWVAIVSHLVSFDVAALRQRQAQTIQAVLNGEREHWLSYLLGIVLTAGIVLCLPGVSPSPTRAIPARWTPTRRMPDHPRLSRNANQISDQSAHAEIEGFALHPRPALPARRPLVPASHSNALQVSWFPSPRR